MYKFLACAAVAASALLATSANASDLLQNPSNVPTMRVAVQGKTYDQLEQEIRVAAQAVCSGEDSDCVVQALAGAERQLHALGRPTANELAAAHVERIARN